MTQEQVLAELIASIAANQALNGITEPKIIPSTRPIADLKSFSSLNALEVLIDIEQKFEEKYAVTCELEIALFYAREARGGMTKEMTHGTLSVEQVAENIHSQLIVRGK